MASAQSVTLPNGIEYRIVKKGKGTKTAKVSNFISIILKGTCSGQTLFDTKQINKGVNSPVNFPVQKKQFNGDVMEVLSLLHEGDSAVIRIPQDSFFRRAPQAIRKGVKPGDPVIYTVGVYGIKTAAEFKKAQDDYNNAMAQNAKNQAIFRKQQADAAKAQKAQLDAAKKQDVQIASYLTTNKITNAEKLASGVYVIMEKEGSGEFVKTGYEVTMNYDWQVLNGKKFDSNIDSAFGHVAPVKVLAGQRQLLQGWDLALQKFKKGSKGTVIIPSASAYGSEKYGIRANDTLPGNSIVKLEVDVLDLVDVVTLAKETALKDDATIQSFLKEKSITATKTNSGLYYIIAQEGNGDSPKFGDEVKMNYTGMFLDGKKFDSNEDSAFNHVTPFSFALGKNAVIKGWDEAVAMLKKGSKAKIILPSAIAYGSTGNPQIPANSVLQFDVELIDFKKAAEAPKPAPMQMNGSNIKVEQSKKK
jgi:FKBP-type peptidyl-prolyl cis-trans isomerase FkpA